MNTKTEDAVKNCLILLPLNIFKILFPKITMGQVARHRDETSKINIYIKNMY